MHGKRRSPDRGANGLWSPAAFGFFLSTRWCKAAELLRRGGREAEELEIGGDLLEQHIDADLVLQPRARAAARKGVSSCFITTSPTKVDGSMRSQSTGRGSLAFMPSGVALAMIYEPAGSLQPVTTQGRSGASNSRPVCCWMRGRGRGASRAAPALASEAAIAEPTPPQTTTSALAPRHGAALGQESAHKAFAVEHVAHQPAAFAQAHHIAESAANLDRGACLIEQRHGRHLVGHGDERALDVA